MSNGTATLLGATVYTSDHLLVGKTISEIRGMYGDDKGVGEGVPFVTEIGKGTIRVDDKYRIKAGDRVTFKPTTLPEPSKATPVKAAKVIPATEPFAEEQEAIKKERAVRRGTREVKVQVKADKAGKEPKMGKKKRISKVVNYCKHGKFVGFQWCGHRRHCTGRQLTAEQFGKMYGKEPIKFPARTTTRKPKPVGRPPKIDNHALKDIEGKVSELFVNLKDELGTIDQKVMLATSGVQNARKAVEDARILAAKHEQTLKLAIKELERVEAARVHIMSRVKKAKESALALSQI